MFLRLPSLRFTAKRRSLFLGLAISGILAVVLACWIVSAGPRITISRQTTYLTGPLDVGGYVDYLRALNQRSVTADQNALPLLFKVWGPPYGRDPVVKHRYFELMGTEAPPEDRYSVVKFGQRVRAVRSPDSPYFVPFQEYLRNHGFAEITVGGKWEDDDFAKWNEVFHAVAREPWQANDYPAVAAWLETNAKLLDLVIEASQKPGLFSPIINDGGPFDVCNPHLGVIDNLSKALAARAMLAVKAGDAQSSSRDLLALHRLARLLAQGRSAEEYRQALGLDQRASRLDREFAMAFPLPPRFEYQRALNELPPFADAATKIDQGERLGCLSNICGLARIGHTRFDFMAAVSSQVPGMPVSLVDWDHVLATINAWYDREAAAQRLLNRSARRRAEAELGRELEHLEDQAYRGRPLSAWLRPRREIADRVAQQWLFAEGLGGGLTYAVDATDAERELTRVTFALADFRDQYGGFPARLNELAPRYLKAMPQDPFSSAPFVYRPSEDGASFVLYSVGPNEQDDGETNRKNDRAADDIVVQVP